MLNESQDIRPPNPSTGSELKVTEQNFNYSISDVRKKVLTNWSIGDQKPLISRSVSNGQQIKPKRTKPSKSPKTPIDWSTDENKDKMNRWVETIDGVVQSEYHSSLMDDSINDCNGVLTHPTETQLNSDSKLNLNENNLIDNSVTNGLNSEEPVPQMFNSWKIQKRTEINPIIIKDIDYNSNGIKIGIEINDKIPKKLKTNTKEIKPKKEKIRKTNKLNQNVSKSNNRKKNPIKVKMSFMLSKNSVQNAFLNQFQAFISRPKVLADNNEPQNTFCAKKYINKNKSESQIMAEKIKIRRIKPNIKIKRNKTKPLVIKDLNSQKSFLDFVAKKYPPIKEGVPFIQDRSCKDFTKDFEASALTYCLDCNDKRSNSQTCRFYQYRTLIKRGEKLEVYAFAEEGNATQEDCKVWLPVSEPKNLDIPTAKFLLTFVGKELCKLYNEEQSIGQQYMSLTWKKPVKGIRELCDVCQTTIFNTHYVCPKCGLAVCVDCFDCRRTESNSNHSNRRNRDEFGWHLCNEKEKHDLSSFHLAIFITKAVFGSIDSTLHIARNYFNVMGDCNCDRIIDPNLKLDLRQACESIDLRVMYPHVPQQYLCDDRMLVLTDPNCKDNLTVFGFNWLKGFPVLIQSVHLSLNTQLWSPENFNKNFGKQTNSLVNCMTGTTIYKHPMSDFWNGFEDIDQRLKDEETGEEMILKLKDWPPNAEFRDILPLWFDDLMGALPLREYTKWDGNRNLASRLPEFFVRPDLGPKMYCAYGSVLHPDKGTTNLHLDMSDAVNVMIYVGIAKKDNKPLESHLNEANETLRKSGCDQQMMERVNSAGKQVGAVWHIWRAEDADKIRDLLHKVAKEKHIRKESNNDPIHDQSWYLDEPLRTRLEREYGVKGLAIAQCLGDSILVPAGAPHQVQNIHSCIKVAGEFVSPENVSHCLSLTHEFRRLSKRHNNHEDKLQIKNIIYHTVKDSLSALIRSQPAQPIVMPYHCLPSPPKQSFQSTPLSIPSNYSLNCNPLSEPLIETFNTYTSLTSPTPIKPTTPPNSLDKPSNSIITYTAVDTFANTLITTDMSIPTNNITSTSPPLELEFSAISAPIESEPMEASATPLPTSPPTLSVVTLNQSTDLANGASSPPILSTYFEHNYTLSADTLESIPPNDSQTKSIVSNDLIEMTSTEPLEH